MSYEVDEARLIREELLRYGGLDRQMECLSDIQSLEMQMTHMLRGLGRVEDLAEMIAYGLIAIRQMEAQYNCETIVDKWRREIVAQRLARLDRTKETKPNAGA